MHRSNFEAELRSAGCAQVEAKDINPKPANLQHAHDYDIRGIVLDGIFIVTQDDRPATFRAGDIFSVPAGKMHSEGSSRAERAFLLVANISRTASLLETEPLWSRVLFTTSAKRQ